MADIALFGGSFNPVHNGHVNLVKEVAAAIKPDRVIVIPTYISPFKMDSCGFVADGKDRLEMCRLAFEKLDHVEVSDYELSLKKVSYTINTLEHFKALYPNDSLYFIMGSDMLMSLDRWYRFEDIMKLCTIVAASRENEQSDISKLHEKAEELQTYGKVIVVNISAYEMSSTLIREKILNNSDISCYLPEKVVKYISDMHIYRNL